MSESLAEEIKKLRSQVAPAPSVFINRGKIDFIHLGEEIVGDLVAHQRANRHTLLAQHTTLALDLLAPLLLERREVVGKRVVSVVASFELVAQTSAIADLFENLGFGRRTEIDVNGGELVLLA